MPKKRTSRSTKVPPMLLSELARMKALLAQELLAATAFRKALSKRKRAGPKRPVAPVTKLVADRPEDPVIDLRKGNITRCPNGHTIEPIFDVCNLREGLERNHVQCFCFPCGKSWTLSPGEQANVKTWLEGLKAPCDTS